jgi:hypothetical protein
MLCARCSGFIRLDQYLGTEGELYILRCLNCGAVTEPRMDLHRNDLCVPSLKSRGHRLAPHVRSYAVTHGNHRCPHFLLP